MFTTSHFIYRLVWLDHSTLLSVQWSWGVRWTHGL